MEDTIEICTGCGKMPRAIDRMSGSFTCSRCGNKETMQVNADSYEKVASELDQKFHTNMLKEKVAAAADSPGYFPKKKKKTAAKKAKKAKKPAPKKVKKKK